MSQARTRQVYDRHAERYHARFGGWEPYRRKVREFAARVRPAGRVVDLGCGGGASARLLVESGLRVVGYDFSQAMLEIARRECPAARFEWADLRRLPQPERPFDAALASFCIVHFEAAEARAFLVGLPALLLPGGLLYLSFMEGRAAGWQVPSFSEEPLFYNYFDRAWVREVLSGVGLEPIAESTSEYPEEDGSTTTDVFLWFAKR